MAKNRWDYMRQPGYNPPSDACPKCEEPSRVWHAGASTRDGITSEDWTCDRGHRWTTTRPALTAKPE